MHFFGVFILNIVPTWIRIRIPFPCLSRELFFPLDFSSILEVDLVLARKQQREAITGHEVEAASHSLGLLLEYLQTLEDCWTGVRWIRDVLSGTAARLCPEVGQFLHSYCITKVDIVAQNRKFRKAVLLVL